MAGTSQKRRGPITGINVTPLVDVTLVLLAIFMVTAKMVVNPAVPLDLPTASQGEDIQVVFSVLVPVRGPALVDGVAVEDDAELTARAERELLADPDLRAVIQADGAVPHRRVVEVLDALRLAGIARIAFGTLPDTPAASAPQVTPGEATER